MSYRQRPEPKAAAPPTEAAAAPPTEAAAAPPTEAAAAPPTEAALCEGSWVETPKAAMHHSVMMSPK